jgi:hypothetical protein
MYTGSFRQHLILVCMHKRDCYLARNAKLKARSPLLKLKSAHTHVPDTGFGMFQTADVSEIPKCSQSGEI